MIPTDAAMLTALVNWIADKGQVDRVVIIGEDTDYGRGGATALGAAPATRGKKLVNADFYQQGTQHFSTLIARLQSRHPSLVAVYTIGADTQNFLRQWQKAAGATGPTGRIFTDQITQETLDSRALEELTTIHPYDVHRTEPADAEFVARYQQRFNTLPNLMSWAAYEAVKVIAEATRKAGSAEPGPVRDAIATGHFTTLFNDTIRFDDQNLAHLDALILAIQNNRVVALGKAPT